MDTALLHADNHLLVVCKPACVPVVPDDSGDPSLVEAWKDWIKREHGKPGKVFLGVVHRLDRPVSGVVVFARTSKAAERLAAQWRRGSVEKHYLAVVRGRPRLAEGQGGELEQWLVKDASRNVVRAVAPPPPGGAAPRGARLARTRWKLERTVEHCGLVRSLLALEPITGRAHQLRVACRALGCPIEGDLKYGADSAMSDRSIALHAERLALDQPTKAVRLTFRAEVPVRILRLLEEH